MAVGGWRLAAGGWTVASYRITEASAGEVREILERRRGAAEALAG